MVDYMLNHTPVSPSERSYLPFLIYVPIPTPQHSINLYTLSLPYIHNFAMQYNIIYILF